MTLSENAKVPPQPWLTRTLGLANTDGARRYARTAIVNQDPAQIAEALHAFRLGRPGVERLIDELVGDQAEGLALDSFQSGRAARLIEVARQLAPSLSAGVAKVHKRARELIRGECQRVVDTGRLTDADSAALLATSKALGLEKSDLEATLSNLASTAITNRLLALAGNGDLSPEGFAELERLKADLGINSEWPKDLAAKLEDLRALWNVRHGELHAIESPLGLKRGEVAWAVGTAEAHEDRTRTKSVRYGGPAFRVRIAKGISYRAGGYRVARTTEHYDHVIGAGDLVVTNKRLVFSSPAKSMSPSLDSILRIEPEGVNGFWVTRSTGKPTLFILHEADEFFMEILMRAWRRE